MFEEIIQKIDSNYEEFHDSFNWGLGCTTTILYDEMKKAFNPEEIGFIRCEGLDDRYILSPIPNEDDDVDREPFSILA